MAMHRPPAGFLRRQNMNVCVVIHNPHFHNQDFTLLKSNLVFGLGWVVFFFKSPANPEIGDEGKEGQVEHGQDTVFTWSLPNSISPQPSNKKNSLSQKSDSTVSKPTMNNKESEGEGMGQDADTSDAATLVSSLFEAAWAPHEVPRSTNDLIKGPPWGWGRCSWIPASNQSLGNQRHPMENWWDQLVNP